MKTREQTSVAVHLEGPRVTVRDLESRDLDAMDKWRPFDDPLHALWNIPRSSSPGLSLWFAMESSDATRLWFAVERRSDGQLVGTISLREIIRPISARLGIGFGADYVDHGYGSEALCQFLGYFFSSMGFQRLFLDVASANQRAVHVYEKLGFRRAGSHFRDVPMNEDLSFLRREPFRGLSIHFRRHLGRMQLRFVDMVLEHIDWERFGAPECASSVIRADSV